MKNFRNSMAVVAALVLIAMLAFVGSLQMSEDASAAPLAAITPVAATSAISGETSMMVRFYDGEALTADDQTCVELGEYRVMDLEYVIDQGTTNTSTLTLEHTNGAGSSNAVNTTGQSIVAANAADANDLNRFDLYGRTTCVDVDVTNSNPVTVTVYGLARK